MTLSVNLDRLYFFDAESGAPSAVYRRKAYDYGVIHLDMEEAEQASA